MCHHRWVPEIWVRALRWVSDDPQPGIVECRLVDADGVEHVIREKSAVLDAEDRLRPDAAYPMELRLGCRVVREDAAEVEIELDHDIESVDGLRRFRVPRRALA